MTETRTETFQTTSGLKLSLTNLTATVRAAPSEPGSTTARIDAQGDQEYLDGLTITYDRAENRLSLSEAPGLGGSLGGMVISDGDVVIGNGTVQVNSFGRGGSSSVITTGRGGVYIGGSVGGRIIVNGVDVTAAVSGAPAAPVIGRTITVTVPVGTDTGLDDCADVTLARLAGRVRAHISRQGRANITGATGVRIRVKAQSSASVADSTGSLDLTLSGQSSVVVSGKFGDVDLAVSGQSSVKGSGTFGFVDGQVSGQSSVRLTGQAGGSGVTSSGQSDVSISAPARRQGGRSGDWDF